MHVAVIGWTLPLMQHTSPDTQSAALAHCRDADIVSQLAASSVQAAVKPASTSGAMQHELGSEHAAVSQRNTPASKPVSIVPVSTMLPVSLVDPESFVVLPLSFPVVPASLVSDDESSAPHAVTTPATKHHAMIARLIRSPPCRQRNTSSDGDSVRGKDFVHDLEAMRHERGVKKLPMAREKSAACPARLPDPARSPQASRVTP